MSFYLDLKSFLSSQGRTHPIMQVLLSLTHIYNARVFQALANYISPLILDQPFCFHFYIPTVYLSFLSTALSGRVYKHGPPRPASHQVTVISRAQLQASHELGTVDSGRNPSGNQTGSTNNRSNHPTCG